MAWTKTKVAIAAGLALALAAGTSIVAVNMVKTARTNAALARMQGSWEGVMAVDQARMRLVLRIFKTNGAYSAVFDSIDQGAKDIPITKLSAGKDSLHAELPAIRADYLGTINAGGTEISGTWRQLSRSFPLKLQRTTEADQIATPLTSDDYSPRAGSDVQGSWEGTLKVGNAQLRLKLKIAESSPGAFHAEMDSVDQGAQNMPITSLTYDKPAIRFEMPAINGKYEGSMNEGNDQMTGTWSQMGKKYPLDFQRAQTNAEAVEAEKDYGHNASNEVQGHWKGALNIKLHIIFHVALLPDGSYSATLDSPDQGASGIPATAVEFKYPDLRMEWSGIGGVFKGKLESGKLSGTWHQGNASFPLKLER